MTETAINLQAWCDEDSYRYQFEKPFVRGGMMYATDSRRVVRVPAVGEPDTPVNEGKKIPGMKDVFPDFGKVADWRPWPAASGTIEDKIDCPDCDAQGTIGSRDCDECNGEGAIECDMGHDHDCEDCDDGQVGGEKCRRCDGTCKIIGPDRIDCGGVWIDAKYDADVRTLPNPVFNPGDRQVLIKFDGGEAIICGIDLEHRR